MDMYAAANRFHRIIESVSPDVISNVCKRVGKMNRMEAGNVALTHSNSQICSESVPEYVDRSVFDETHAEESGPRGSVSFFWGLGPRLDSGEAD